MFTQQYTVSGKRDQNVFVIISSTKLRRFSWNLVHSFLNKFAAKSCKHFPPHLNNVSTLPRRKLKCSSCMFYHWVVRESNSKIYPPQQICQIRIQLITARVYCDKRCTKCIANLDLSMTSLTNGCHSDDVMDQVVIGRLYSPSLFQFVQINDEYFEHLLLQYSPYFGGHT